MFTKPEAQVKGAIRPQQLTPPPAHTREAAQRVSASFSTGDTNQNTWVSPHPGKTEPRTRPVFLSSPTPAAHILTSKHTLEWASSKTDCSSGVPRVTRPRHSAHVPHGSPKSRRPIPGPPRRVGRPPVVFPSPTANRSCPRPRHNHSPEGKVCLGEGKHRHLAATSPRRSFPRLARPLDSLRGEERTASPRRAAAGAPAQGAGADRRRHLPREELRDRESVREASEPVPPSAAEPLPPPLPLSTGRLRLPSGPKKPAHVTSGHGAAPSAGAAPGGRGLSAEPRPLETGPFTSSVDGSKLQAGLLPRIAYSSFFFGLPGIAHRPRQTGPVWICVFRLTITLTGKLGNLPVRLEG